MKILEEFNTIINFLVIGLYQYCEKHELTRKIKYFQNMMTIQKLVKSPLWLFSSHDDKYYIDKVYYLRGIIIQEITNLDNDNIELTFSTENWDKPLPNFFTTGSNIYHKHSFCERFAELFGDDKANVMWCDNGIYSAESGYFNFTIYFEKDEKFNNGDIIIEHVNQCSECAHDLHPHKPKCDSLDYFQEIYHCLKDNNKKFSIRDFFPEILPCGNSLNSLMKQLPCIKLSFPIYDNYEEDHEIAYENLEKNLANG